MPEVIALGDINVDIIAHFPSYPAQGGDALASSSEFHCGGSAANTARALAWMGLDVSLISRVGPDPLAARVLDNLSEVGVLPAGLQHDPAEATGLMYVVVTPDGERTILQMPCAARLAASDTLPPASSSSLLRKLVSTWRT